MLYFGSDLARKSKSCLPTFPFQPPYEVEEELTTVSQSDPPWENK